MAYSVTKIGYLDVDHLITSLIDEDRIKQWIKDNEDDPAYAIWIEDAHREGVSFHLRYSEETQGEKPICTFYVPESTWETFVCAVNCIEKMRQKHEN